MKLGFITSSYVLSNNRCQKKKMVAVRVCFTNAERDFQTSVNCSGTPLFDWMRRQWNAWTYPTPLPPLLFSPFFKLIQWHVWPISLAFSASGRRVKKQKEKSQLIVDLLFRSYPVEFSKDAHTVTVWLVPFATYLPTIVFSNFYTQNQEENAADSWRGEKNDVRATFSGDALSLVLISRGVSKKPFFSFDIRWLSRHIIDYQ